MKTKVTLSAWIVKTMIVENHMYDDPEHWFYSDDERRTFKETLEPPDGVMIWLGRFIGAKDKECGPMVGALSGYDPDKRKDLRGVRTFVLTFTVRQLAIQMFAIKRITADAPSLDHLVRFFEPTPMWRSATIRIWPDPLDGTVWPPAAILTRHALQALSERYGTSFPLWPGEVPTDIDPVPLLIEHKKPPA